MLHRFMVQRLQALGAEQFRPGAGHAVQAQGADCCITFPEHWSHSTEGSVSAGKRRSVSALECVPVH
jgi:hypothetical protein